MKVFPRNYYIHRRIGRLLKRSPQETVALASAILSRKKKEFPIAISIEVTNHCNLACTTCPQPTLTDEKGFLSADLFRKIIDECCSYPSLRRVIFTGFGEPLIHPQLSDMSRYLKEKRIPYVGTYTNCVLLDEKTTDEILLKSGFDEITLSLNASTRESHEKITGRRDYERVAYNIEYFLRKKKELKIRSPFVNLQLLNLNNIPLNEKRFVEKWMLLLQPGDCVWIKIPHSFAGQVNNPGVKHIANRLKRRPCGQLWNFLFISCNGDVMPCCNDPSKKLKLGNSRGSSLRELWHSSKIMHIREMHMRGEYRKLPLCSDCEIWWYFSGYRPVDTKTRRVIATLLTNLSKLTKNLVNTI